MSVVLGLNAKLFYNVNGAGGSGAWSELTNVKDVTVSVETGEADATTRAAQGWEVVVATLKKGTLDFQMVWNTADAGFQAIKDAFFDNTAIGIAALDGGSTDGEGLMADFMVTKFTRNEPLAEVLTVDVSLKPTYTDFAPVWTESGV